MNEKEWLGEKNQIGIDIWNKKYRHNNESLEEWLYRVSGGNKELSQLIKDKKFLFGGRTLTNRGTENSGSFFNCFTKGHKVISKRGLINIEEIQKGDYVITEDNSWQRVNEVMSRAYNGDLYEVDVFAGFDKTTCTPNHQFLTEDGWTRADRLVATKADKHRYKVAHYIKSPTLKFETNEYCLNLADYFKETEYNKIEKLDDNKIRTVTTFPNSKTTFGKKNGTVSNNNIIVNKDVKYLFGRWIGDGSITKIKKQEKHSVFQIVFNDKTEILACEKCKNILIDDFGVHPTLINNKKQSTLILRVSNHILCTFFFEYFGEKCDGKRIPSELIGDFDLLLGILDSDGSINMDGSMRLVLKSEELLNQIKQSLYLNGINSTAIKPALTTLREKHFVNYSLFVGNAISKYKIIPFLLKQYNDDRMFKSKTKPLFTLRKEEDIYVQVREIKILENQNTVVYNISVENMHSYTVNGLVVHNCYSSGYAPDDYEGLLELNKNIGLTYKSQGGQGISMSKVRPLGSPIGKRFTSDGIVPFMEIFNTTTEQTSQGGARKGALMLSLDIRHKEAETFIKLKSQQGKIEKANLSLEIDDEFMEAICEYYHSGEIITMHEKRQYSGRMLEYDIVPINLYKMLVKNCYDWADPACLFTEAFRNYNLMQYDDNYNIVTSNPCGEQPLPKDFACNLGSLNLNEFVKHPYTKSAEFDYINFSHAIEIAVEALDVVIDENAGNHPLQEQRENSLNYRNIGIGVMGFANCLMKLGIKYGSTQAKKFTNDLFSYLFKKAVAASVELAKEKGEFPKYTKNVLKSDILLKHISPTTLEDIKHYGLRNCSLISIAPTGTISNMFGVSGGCEPEFALEYKRKTISLNNGEDKYYTIYCNSVLEYYEANNLLIGSFLPDYFISSEEINWKDRVDMQSLMQDHVDTAISSTVNLPQNTTTEEIEQLYLYAWQKKLKGITVFRSGCKKFGILTTGNEEQDDKTKDIVKVKEDDISIAWGTTMQGSDDVIGKLRKVRSGCGNIYVTAWFNPSTSELEQVFFPKGSEGVCNSLLVGLSRLISLSLRTGASFDSVIDQLLSVPPCTSYVKRMSTHKDCGKGSSCASIVANALTEMQKEMFDETIDINDIGIKSITQTSNLMVPMKALCPDCGNALINEGGCVNCKQCGYSKCG